jgi:hypothetical protein
MLSSSAIAAILALLVASTGCMIRPAVSHSANSEQAGKTMTAESEMTRNELISIDPALVTLFHAEMASRKVDLSLYNIGYYEYGESYLIATFYKNKKPGLRGSDPVHKDYNVVVSPKEKKVVRVFLSR